LTFSSSSDEESDGGMRKTTTTGLLKKNQTYFDRYLANINTVNPPRNPFAKA